MDGLVAVVLVGIAFVGLVVLHLFFSSRFVIDPQYLISDGGDTVKGHFHSPHTVACYFHPEFVMSSRPLLTRPAHYIGPMAGYEYEKAPPIGTGIIVCIIERMLESLA